MEALVPWGLLATFLDNCQFLRDITYVDHHIFLETLLMCLNISWMHEAPMNDAVRTLRI